MPSEIAAARAAASRARDWTARRDETIRAAHAAGNTLRAIALAVELSPARVHQIVRAEPRADR